MSKIDETTGTEPVTRSGGVDRRAALKKVAIGGAVAWTAPTLLSTRVSAQTAPGCTPKCYPTPDITLNGTSFLYCNTNGQKWVRIQFTVGGDTCPCGNAGRELAIVLVTVSGNGTLKSTIFDPATGVGSLIIGGPGQGALSNGSYNVGVRFRTTCLDRDSDPIDQFCTGTFSFTFSPGNGSCSVDENVGTVTPGGVTCEPPICNAN
jgi:hypothetical protein